MVTARSRTRWLRAALVAPLLVFALSASSHVAFRCTMTGLLMPELCCPSGAADTSDAPSAAQATIDDPGCCERLVTTNVKVPATMSASASPHDVRLFVRVALASPPALAPPTLLSDGPRARTAGPPHLAAPVFLLKRSFLI